MSTHRHFSQFLSYPKGTCQGVRLHIHNEYGWNLPISNHESKYVPWHIPSFCQRNRSQVNNMSVIKCAHKHYANYLILICLPNPCNCKYIFILLWTSELLTLKYIQVISKVLSLLFICSSWSLSDRYTVTSPGILSNLILK